MVAGSCATAWLMGVLEPSTRTERQKLVLLALAAPALGLVADFAFRASRITAYVLGAAFGGAALWAFGAAIMQKPPVPAFIERMKASIKSGRHPEAFDILVKADGKDATLLRRVVLSYISYSLGRVGEVVAQARDVDRIMGFGFNWAPPSVRTCWGVCRRWYLWRRRSTRRQIDGGSERWKTEI